MASKYEFDMVHPILDAMTHVVIDLYQSDRNEETRVRLLKMEALLQEKLEEIQQAKDAE